MKTTEWFPGDVDPVHAGVYQRLYISGNARYCRWDGTTWHRFALSVEDASLVNNPLPMSLKWRGLMEPAK
jgi:hypothetical protein